MRSDAIPHWNNDSNEFGMGFSVVQTSAFSDPVLRFGPLSQSLSEFFAQGFTLEVHVPHYKAKHNMRVQLRLVAPDGTQYALNKVHPRDVQKECLSKLILVKKDMTVYEGTPDADRDPLSILRAQFPVRRKRKPVLIGNMTLREHVTETLN